MSTATAKTALTVTGLTEVGSSLRARVARMKNLEPAMRVIAAAVDQLVDDSFRNQASPSGTPWAPLSGVTVYRRIARKKSGDRITYQMRRVMTKRGKLTKRAQGLLAPGAMQRLTDTGRLRRSLFARGEAKAVAFGASKVAYARAQHFGNPDNRMFGGAAAPIPARPFLPVERAGSKLVLMRSGAAGRLWREARAILAAYIVRGKAAP